MRLVVFFSIIILTVSCSKNETADQRVLVDGIPSHEQIADSLTKSNVRVMKWAVDGNEIVYAKPETVDWTAELETIRKTNINHLRYKENYLVSDTFIGNERRVDFTAKSEDQDVQRVSIRMRKGVLTYYFVEKIESSIFSSSTLTYEFKPEGYTLSLKQSIPWVFESAQYVSATFISDGDYWLGHLSMAQKKTPIQMIIDLAAESKSLVVKNGAESIGFNRSMTYGDTIVFESDYFNSSFHLSQTSDSTIEGYWLNNKREEPRKLTLSAKKNVVPRFKALKVPSQNISGSHAAIFYDREGNPEDAVILRLNQVAHHVSGSFLTETGDYRFLEGVVRNDSILLSTMDGTHAYLFEASINGAHLKGTFYSGPTYRQEWSATLMETKVLRDPATITALNDSVEFDFSFPDDNGTVVSLSDSNFIGKPMIVSIMGTWCSNCLDEAVFLKEVYELYHLQGLEVIALDFELISDSVRAIENIRRHKSGLGLHHPVLLACLSSTKQRAADLLPALSGVYSYPTMIVLDKNHKVVRVHTGFNGPATGMETYDAFRMEYLGLIDALVQQP